MSQYTMGRIYDDRLDDKEENPPPVISRFTAAPEEALRYSELIRLDTWILNENLDWHLKDRKYWRKIFKRAEAETFIPGMGVMRPTYGASPTDEVREYWYRLARTLPTGERNDHNMWGWRKVKDALRNAAGNIVGYGGERKAAIYNGHPRTSSEWIRILRYWIRTEKRLVDSEVIRKLSDYPKEVERGLEIAIKRMTNNFDCVDNIRFADTDKPGEMRRFKRQAADGCCGSTQRYVIIGSKQYIIGCNYGH